MSRQTNTLQCILRFCGPESVVMLVVEREEWVCLDTQSSLILCDPMDCSPPGSSVHGILQARILERVAFPPPGDLPDPGIEPTSLTSPTLPGGFFTTGATCKATGIHEVCAFSWLSLLEPLQWWHIKLWEQGGIRYAWQRVQCDAEGSFHLLNVEVWSLHGAVTGTQSATWEQSDLGQRTEQGSAYPEHVQPLNSSCIHQGCCSVAKSCLTLCDPLDCSTSGFPVLHHLPEFAQTHVPGVSDATHAHYPHESSMSSTVIRTLGNRPLWLLCDWRSAARVS